MLTTQGHLTYCTNIHGGEEWDDHFPVLKTNFPQVKQAVSPHQPMGLGLRLSDRASQVLSGEERLLEFKDWLAAEEAYIFTMNGFPFGAFHNHVVKEQVHAPDWTTGARLEYTLRMFDTLTHLLPSGMDGGISTSPLSYRHWYTEGTASWSAMRRRATRQIVEVAEHLIRIQRESGKVLHLDIEPEPDGVLETGEEFITWYDNELLPEAKSVLCERLGITAAEAEEAVRMHIRLCYDVCHFALGYEDHAAIVDALAQRGMRIGKIQISAAIKATLPADPAERRSVGRAFMAFDEPVYLHQVIARRQDDQLTRYRDLPDAQLGLFDEAAAEWRSHFHVPIFLEDLGRLQSTQSDIRRVLELHEAERLTNHLEVETYTWGVLPEQLRLPIADSISRELDWVLHRFSGNME